MLSDYERQVYTAVLGKVIGVYWGRPYEGWTKARVQERFGIIDHYVNRELGAPLVVSDDDICGTMTFIRALEDSGLYAETPCDFFGKTWLNYLLEKQTILWWGGMGVSTEHTAYLRLKHGVPSPQSGSAAINGSAVAEQIGAQIFIDAFGMVAPGNPRLAADLARRAARVSHDGEAVHAAQVVAAMVSIAFEVKDMDRILDEAVRVIPPGSLIAQVHRDVRAWAAQDADWNKTYERIDEKYGYAKYPGGCHVVPNHAAMVMAWAYAKNDFFRAMEIAGTMGWDTDCNAGNVGSVAALVAGLDHLCDRYDFRTPFADRLILPTAEGTYAASDVAEQALMIAAIGRKVQGLPKLTPPKDGALFHFELPGSVQGFQGKANNAAARNTAAPAGFAGEHCLAFEFRASPGQPAEIAVPCLYRSEGKTPYAILGTPRLYNGMTVSLSGRAPVCRCSLRMAVRALHGDELRELLSPAKELVPGEGFAMEWSIDGAADAAVSEFALRLETDEATVQGTLLVDRIDFGGKADLALSAPGKCLSGDAKLPGWISSMDLLYGRYANQPDGVLNFQHNEGEGYLVTGSRRWKDAALACDFQIRVADSCGILLRYQGCQRHYAFRFRKFEVQLVRRSYGETVLATAPYILPRGKAVRLHATAIGSEIALRIDGKKILAATDAALQDGGAGLFAEMGVACAEKLVVKTGEIQKIQKI